MEFFLPVNSPHLLINSPLLVGFDGYTLNSVCDRLEKLSLSGLLSAVAVCSWWCTHSIHVCKVNALKSLTCNKAKRASISTASDSVRLRTERIYIVFFAPLPLVVMVV